MQVIDLKVSLKHTFGNLLRHQHVLIFLTDHQHQLLLGHKPQFYPAGIYRMLGGGINPNEKIIEAAARELTEETRILAAPDSFELIFQVNVNAQVGAKKYLFTTYICRYKKSVDVTEIHPADDIRAVVPHTVAQLDDLIKRYESFDESQWYFDGPEYKHLWQDYGKVYGPIHKLARDYLANGE